MIWDHIEKFHDWWASLKNVQSGMGSDQFPLWWYDFHFLVFILCDDKYLLLLMMFGRMQLKHWDLGISWNDNFRKVRGTFGSFQRRQWDPCILLSYLNWVKFLWKKGQSLGEWL